MIPADADVTVNGAVSAKILNLAGSLCVKGNLTATTLAAASKDAAVTCEKVMTFTDLTKQARGCSPEADNLSNSKTCE